MRLGIFGGTFDPIHLGHMQVLEQLPEFVELSGVMVMPCGIPPNGKDPMFDAKTRMTMVEAALQTYKGPNFPWWPSPREIARRGPSYTVDTLRSVVEAFPENRPALILGEEELWEFERWRDPRAIVEMADIIAVDNGRSVWTFDELPDWIRTAVTDRVAMDPPLSVSSTTVRHRIQAELSVRFLVPDVIIPLIEAWIRST